MTLISAPDIDSSTSVYEGHSQTQHLTAEEGPEGPIYTERGKWEPVPKAGAACLDQAGALEGKLWLTKAEIMLSLSLTMFASTSASTDCAGAQ